MPAALEKQKSDFLRVATDPWDFLAEFGRINDPPPAGRGIIPYQPWAHLARFVAATQGYRLIQLMKARQIGITWTLAGLALHTTMFNEGANVLLLSKGEAEATELLGRCRLMHRELPPWLRVSQGPGGVSVMTFPVMDSKIRALPATEDAGRTETATLVICDEWDFHPYAEANYAAVKPTIDAGGQFIGVSTVDKAKIDSLFKRLWRMGPASGFHQMFFGWEQRPGRNQVWYDDTKRGYPDLVKWEQEYPSTAEEALAPSQGLCYFDTKVLMGLMAEAKEGHIFRPYVVGRRYGAAIDPAGDGRERCSLSIKDCQTGMFVVDYTTDEPPDTFALAAYNILERYGFPLLGIEANGVGLYMTKKLQELSYPISKLIFQDEKRTKVGIISSGNLRDTVLVDLAEGIRQGDIIVVSREAIKEMLNFIQKPKGHPEHAEGAFDDRVSSMRWANWASKQLPSMIIRVKSESYCEA